MYGLSEMKLIQYNVQHWKSHHQQLIEIYRTVNSDIILINSHGLRNDEDLKIPSYRVSQQSDVRSSRWGCDSFSTQHEIKKKLSIGPTGLLKIEVPAEYDSIIIATHYLPPRCQDGLLTDILQNVANSHQPYYFVGDLNASARLLQDSWTNDRGRVRAAYVQNHRVEHISTEINTFFGTNGK